jgi:hypothetical protein
MSKIPVEKFAWWIFGYQKFSESVIRASICREKGWKDITNEVQPPRDIIKTLDDLDWGGPLEPLREQAKKALGARNRRLVLDAAFRDCNGKVFIGEFKSWGGFQTYDPVKLEQGMKKGEWFPDRLAIRVLEDRRDPKKKDTVSGFVFATNLDPKTCNSGSREFDLGRLHVEIVDIPRLLKENGPGPADDVEELLKDLDAAVEMVKRYVMKGNLLT